MERLLIFFENLKYIKKNIYIYIYEKIFEINVRHTQDKDGFF